MRTALDTTTTLAPLLNLQTPDPALKLTDSAATSFKETLRTEEAQAKRSRAEPSNEKRSSTTEEYGSGDSDQRTAKKQDSSSPSEHSESSAAAEPTSESSEPVQRAGADESEQESKESNEDGSLTSATRASESDSPDHQSEQGSELNSDGSGINALGLSPRIAVDSERVQHLISGEVALPETELAGATVEALSSAETSALQTILTAIAESTFPTATTTIGTAGEAVDAQAVIGSLTDESNPFASLFASIAGMSGKMQAEAVADGEQLPSQAGVAGALDTGLNITVTAEGAARLSSENRLAQSIAEVISGQRSEYNAELAPQTAESYRSTTAKTDLNLASSPLLAQLNPAVAAKAELASVQNLASGAASTAGSASVSASAATSVGSLTLAASDLARQASTSTPNVATPGSSLLKGAVGSSSWQIAISEKVATMAAQRLTEAEIQLDPPELGQLQVRVTVNQDQAQVSFVSPHAAVREALDQTALRLREMFSGEGLNLVDVDVSDQSHPDSSEGEESHTGGSEVVAEHTDADATVTEQVDGTVSLNQVDQFV